MNDTVNGVCNSGLIRSHLFQQFLAQGFWHAHHVDLVWRHDGKDVREEADWLKDLWYAIRRGPRPIGWARYISTGTEPTKMELCGESDVGAFPIYGECHVQGRADSVRGMLSVLVQMCEDAPPGTWKNGNTADNGTDEGDVMAWRTLELAKALLADSAPACHAQYSSEYVERLRGALHEACLVYAQHGDEPPKAWQELLHATPHAIGRESNADRAALAKGEIPAHIASPEKPSMFRVCADCSMPKTCGLEGQCIHARIAGPQTPPQDDARDAARYRHLRANWDDFSGTTARDPGPWLDSTIDAVLGIGKSSPSP